MKKWQIFIIVLATLVGGAVGVYQAAYTPPPATHAPPLGDQKLDEDAEQELAEYKQMKADWEKWKAQSCYARSETLVCVGNRGY